MTTALATEPTGGPTTAPSFYGVVLGEPAEPVVSDTAALLEVFEILKPRASATPLIRIGGDADGSYLVPEDLDGITTCFSPGVNRIKYFEDFVAERYGIASHMCDFTSDVGRLTTPLVPGMQTFVKKWLDLGEGDDRISLEDWVAEHGPEGDLLLQMDIEGAEYRNVLATSDETLARFRVIVLEVHGLDKMLQAPVLRDVIAPFFTKLAGAFTTVHAHPNNCCGDFAVPGTDVTIPRILELTLVRNDRFVPAPGPPALPHPLDVSRNVPRKPPLFLSEAWCDHDRPLTSRVKMLEDGLAYRADLNAADTDPELAAVLALTMQSVQTLSALVVPPPPQARLAEVAAGRPYRLSTAYERTSRTGVVRESPSYFFHTEFGPDQSIRVDLGREHRVRRVEVTNRRGGHQTRARHLFVLLERGRAGGAPSVFGMDQAGRQADGAWQERGVDVPDVVTRYVTVRSPTTTALHFADLRVYAVVEEPTPPPQPTRPLVRRALGSARRRARRIRARLGSTRS